MKNTLETRLGIFFALTLIVAVTILQMVGVAEYFKPGDKVFANFKTVQELKKGDLVKMAGVEVGRVDEITLTNEQVRITMKIKKRGIIRTDSRATIKFTGLMGQNFVSLDFGTAKGLTAMDNATLATTEQPDLSALMVKLDSVAGGIEGLTKSFTPDNLAPLFGPITDFMKQNSTNLTAIMANTREATEQLNHGKGTIGKLLNDDTLYTSAVAAVAGLQASSAEIKSTITEARSIIDQINSGQGTLGKLAKDDALYRETTLAMMNLREVIEKMNKGQGSVGQLINDDSFLKNAKMTLQKLDKATEGLEDQGPLSVLGSFLNTLF
jgi:phospholipid/cholesterol/gamma-HCH transport system substrate-binding protein